MSPQTRTPECTRERLLDAAEELFARHGIAGTTLRALTRRARANLAAVHYHFGSKEALLDAVVERRAASVNAERLEALDALVARHAPGEPAAEAILAAFFEPVLHRLHALEQEGRKATLARLLARIEALPEDEVTRIVRRHFGETLRRYLGALQAALPHLPEWQVAERFRFALALLNQLFAGSLEHDVIPGHPPHRADADARARHAIAYIAAGLRAPALETAGAPARTCEGPGIAAGDAEACREALP